MALRLNRRSSLTFCHNLRDTLSCVNVITCESVGVVEVRECDVVNSSLHVRLGVSFCDGSNGSFRALVDTGASLCLLRRSLVPTKFLRPAARPRRFVSAGGAVMSGGGEGLFVACQIEGGPKMRLWFYVVELVEECILSLNLLTRLGGVLNLAPVPTLSFPDGGTAVTATVTASSTPYTLLPGFFDKFCS